MPLSVIFIALVSFSVFLPFVFFVARESDESRKMRARFTMLQTGGAGGLSSRKETVLLRGAPRDQAGALTGIPRWTADMIDLDSLLLQAGSTSSVLSFMRTSGLLLLGAALLTLAGTRQVGLSVLFGCAGATAPYLQLRLRARRRLAAMDKALPQVMDMISRALRAGHSLPAAIGIVSEEAAEPARSAFGEVFQKQRFGLPLREALVDLVRCFPSQDLKVLLTAVLVQRDTGGNLVRILERTSTVIRERLKLQGDVMVHTAQGRMTGWVLCLLPVGMLGVLMVTNPSYPKALLADPLGRKLVYVGVFLLGLGAFLIQRIVKSIEV